MHMYHHVSMIIYVSQSLENPPVIVIFPTAFVQGPENARGHLSEKIEKSDDKHDSFCGNTLENYITTVSIRSEFSI